MHRKTRFSFGTAKKWGSWLWWYIYGFCDVFLSANLGHLNRGNPPPGSDVQASVKATHSAKSPDPHVLAVSSLQSTGQDQSSGPRKESNESNAEMQLQFTWSSPCIYIYIYWSLIFPLKYGKNCISSAEDANLQSRPPALRLRRTKQATDPLARKEILQTPINII